MCAHSCGCVWLSRRVCDCHCFCFCRVEAYPQVAVSPKVVMVVPGWGVCCVVLGLVDTPSRVTKGFFVGALLGVWGSIGCSCWALRTRVQCLWLFVCGVVLCENCIVDASIFLFCVLVFIPVCLCVRVFCYGRMVDALAC